jgi:hypothetical protein
MPNSDKIDNIKAQIELPESAKESLKALFAQRQQAEHMIQTYIRALQDALGIQGTGWTLELGEMAFVQRSSNGKVEADVVGAIAGDS